MAKLFFSNFLLPCLTKVSLEHGKMLCQEQYLQSIFWELSKRLDGDNVVFYDGWNPQKRGEKIAKEFFTTSLIEQRTELLLMS